ncbi:MAG: methylmalonyl Co-A mutase-associated GTPase MeaB [Actinobacteria bacterium]|nr:methylmalonyl Co-A mutase-associated GTPase MeaB [Actinomycetota bacterium]
MAIDVDSLVERAVAGDARAVARLLSLVEDASPQAAEVAAALMPHTGRAQVVGITGSPGVGKSTITSAIVASFRARGQRVGVLAIDPSSPFSGGALLGDRIRMQEHATDPDVFIRSMASRGHLGGLAWATPQALRVLDAAGCDVVLVETVGVGQSEIEVIAVADSVIVLLAPGMGDGIQAAKAGILEIGDLFVVNKADRDGAESTAREIRHMISLGQRVEGGWQPPVLLTVASRSEGVDGVIEALDRHREWAVGSGAWLTRRHQRAADEIEAIALTRVRQRFERASGDNGLDGLADAVASGTLDPFAAADRLLGESRP